MAALLNSLTKIFTVSIPHNPQRSYAPAAQRTSRENAFCSWPTFSSSLMAPVSIGLGLHQFGTETEVVATNKIRLCSRQLVATNSNRPKRLNPFADIGLTWKNNGRFGTTGKMNCNQMASLTLSKKRCILSNLHFVLWARRCCCTVN